MSLARISKIKIRLLASVFFLCVLMSCNKNSSSQYESNDDSYITETMKDMKLYFDDVNIPVIWENNESVSAIEEEVANKEIIVSMTMYGGNEQFGPLGKTYPSNDTRLTTKCGDIVLYESDQIVVFYGSNTWSYTKLGSMDLSNDLVISMLSKKNVMLKLTK